MFFKWYSIIIDNNDVKNVSELSKYTNDKMKNIATIKWWTLDREQLTFRISVIQSKRYSIHILNIVLFYFIILGLFCYIMQFI